MKSEDINDRAIGGTLPIDPTVEAKPVTKSAKLEAEDAKRVVTVKAMLNEAHGAIGKKTRDVITTGHYEIDRDTSGFQKEFVWIFGAKSHWGKSSYAVMVADENLKRGKRVLIVSAEDPSRLYGERLLMRRARVNRYGMQSGRLSSDELSRVTNVVSRGEDVPVYLNSIGKSVEWATKQVRRLVLSESIDLVMFDYLHAFDKEKNLNTDRRGILNYIARMMTDTVKELGCAGLIFGQVTPDTKADVPDMYEIRDSKDVVNAADAVAIGYMPKAQVERNVNGQRVVVAEKDERCVVVAKNKPGPGPAGRIYRMGSDQEHGCFDIVDDPNRQFDDMLENDLVAPHWSERQ